MRDSAAQQEETCVEVAQAPCAGCLQLRGEVARLLEDRDRLLLELARERERSAALLLSWPPEPTDLGPPLRHRVVDALNERLKRHLPAAHVRLKGTALRLLRRAK
jgi:hypothetical protein